MRHPFGIMVTVSLIAAAALLLVGSIQIEVAIAVLLIAKAIQNEVS